MNWSDISNAVAKAAPWVGSLLGGKAGEAVGNLVAGVLGTEATPEAVHAELVKNPEAFIKLRQMEIEKEQELARIASQDFKVQVEADIAHRKIDTGDIQNARSRDASLKLAGHHNYRADIMLFLAFAGLCFVIYLVWHKAGEMPQHVFGLFNMTVGMLLKMISDGFQFEFGSSRGSKEKDLTGKK